jgi:ABC-2 type transport system permease protein
MWALCKKELRQFFSNLTGYIAILLFLLLNGLFLFVFPESNLFDFGYASLDKFFELAPWVLLMLIPAITMRSFADEFKGGTYEILQTLPLSRFQIITGKYLAALIVVVIAILPTFIYVFTISKISTGGIDGGGIMGSYVGLFFLAAVFTAIGVCCSSLTANPVVSFLLSAFTCFVIYSAFAAVSAMPVFQSGTGYFIELLGIDSHYKSISRGVIDSRDIVYFLSVIFLFLFLTAKNLLRR